jgi:hypothetical protein
MGVVALWCSRFLFKKWSAAGAFAHQLMADFYMFFIVLIPFFVSCSKLRG